MALALYNRVQQTGTANTTVSFTLTGAVTGYQSFAVIGDTNTTYYTATDTSGSWEVGVGTYSTTGPTLTRTTILSSSNSGSAVTFSGTVNVWVDYPAEKAVSTDTLAYPPAIGGTTPSTGTFTTLTAQTEVLNGTGQNLIRQSNTWTTTWSPGNVTAATTVATNDPLGTTTAYQLTESTDGVATNHAIGQGINTPLFVGTTYTWSMYVKAANRSWIYLSNFDNNRRGAWFDLANGVLGTVESGVTAVISSQGNGWYRCSITTTLPSISTLYPYVTTSTGNNIESYVGTGVVSVYVWRAQLQFGSVATTYVPTTTAIVWNVPSLSFISSATSSIGLQSDGSLYVQPAGTGALQAQATTSSTTGGNARGANAVDWQTSRTAASQVASATQSTISGGVNHTVSSQYGAIGGGTTNTVGSSGFVSTISGGFGNNSNNSYTFVGGGTGNTASGIKSLVVGGESNSALGSFNYVGGGYANSGTSGSAVTTQSGTMNGTTAVTLSGSNASIKVGQLILGTSIASGTYVAAVSGTSLTLSQNASGSSTSTLSFYTPHGVVVGGGNNQATGSYSFIGGGGDAGTAANRNVASGDWSVVGGGRKNTASGIASFVGGGGVYQGNTGGSFPNLASGNHASVVGGLTNTASGESSFIGCGYLNQSSAIYSSILGGTSNTSSGIGGSVLGGYYGTTRGITGNHVISACQSPITTANGVSQSALLILAKQTTDATATVLTSDPSGASTTNQVILPNNSAYTFKGTMIANVTGGGNTSSWEFRGCIKRGADAASTALVGTPRIDNIGYDAGASTWAFTLTADTSNGGLAVTVTGQASTTIRWVCCINTVEVTY